MPEYLTQFSKKLKPYEGSYNTDIENANFAKLTRGFVVGYLYMLKMLMWY